MIDLVVIRLNTINIWCEHGFSLFTMVELMITMKGVKDGSTGKDWLTFQDKENQPPPIIENISKNALISIISVLQYGKTIIT